MKNLWKDLLKFLPLVIGLVTVCFVTTAQADILDKAVDLAGRAAAFAMGIDTTDNCVPPQAYSSCLFCPLFKVLFNAGNHVAAKSYGVFSSDLGKLIAVFLAVSLALIVLKNVASMGSKDPGTIINDIMKKTFVCVVIFLIITKNYYNILNLTLIPIIETGLNFADIPDQDSPFTTFCSAAGGIEGYLATLGAEKISEIVSSSSAGKVLNSLGIGGGLPSSIGSMFICAAENIEMKIHLLFENGRWALCLGTGPHRLFHVLPHPIYLIDGLILYLGGIFFLVAYPWVLGDALLQLGISMALLPFAIAGYAFEGTKSYLPKVFTWILHSLFVFIFMAVLMTCVLTYIGNMLIGATSVIDPKVLFTDPNVGVAFFGPNMIMIIFVLVIGYSYMPMTKELAETFSEGSAGVSAAQKFGTELTEPLEGQAEKAFGKATDIAIDTTKGAVNSASLRARALGRRSMIGMTNRFGATNSLGGKTLSFGGITYSTTTDAQGKSTLKREWTNPINGRKHEMLSDKYITIRRETDKNGNLIKSQVEFKKDFLKKHLVNADGSVNMNTYNTLMSSTMAQQPEIKKQIMAAMAEQRLKTLGKDIGTYYRSRTITIDPSNPNKILVEQVDQTGKTTVFSMEINSQTGQMAVGFKRQRDRNRYENAAHMANISRKALGRAANIGMVGKIINTLSGGRDTVNLGIVKYEIKTDAYGDKYYERTTRKYGLFGAKKIKRYELDGVTHSQQTRAGTVYSPKKTIDNPFSEDYEIFFDNGVISTSTVGVRDPDTGHTQGEVTIAKVSAAAQQGHDSIKAQFDDNQVVDLSGNVSDYLRATVKGDPSTPNLYNLEFGMDDFLGQTSINGHSVRDFFVQDIFVERRRREANKFGSNFGQGIL